MLEKIFNSSLRGIIHNKTKQRQKADWVTTTTLRPTTTYWQTTCGKSYLYFIIVVSRGKITPFTCIPSIFGRPE